MGTEKEIVISAQGLKKSFHTGEMEQTIFENLDLEIYKRDFLSVSGILSEMIIDITGE